MVCNCILNNLSFLGGPIVSSKKYIVKFIDIFAFVFLYSAGVVHALHVGNASSELTCISNIQEYINARTLPILPHILNG